MTQEEEHEEEGARMVGSENEGSCYIFTGIINSLSALILTEFMRILFVTF